MAINVESLRKYLIDSSSGDNEARQNAQKALEYCVKNNPDETAVFLVNEARENVNDADRQRAILTLRAYLVTDEPDGLWNKLSAHIQPMIIQSLLSDIETETKKVVRMNICNLICVIANKPEFNYYDLYTHIATLINSNKYETQACGLYILSELYPNLDKDALNKINNLCFSNNTNISMGGGSSNNNNNSNNIMVYAKSPSNEVKIQFLNFILVLVQYERAPIWKQFQVTIPDILVSIHNMIIEKNELAIEALTKIVEIIDTGVSFFKPYMHDLVDLLSRIGSNADISDDCRHTAMEAIVGLAESQPNACLMLPNFVGDIIDLTMQFLLMVESDEEWAASIDYDNSNDNILKTSEVGEATLDRLIAALSAENVLNIIFNYISQYITRSEWQYRLVAITAISLTAEYLSENDIETHLFNLVSILLDKIKDPHYRVRFAVCQAIGQMALDLEPTFQNNYAQEILKALIETLDDEEIKVRTHACAALVNFMEETDPNDLAPFADILMHKFYDRIKPNQPMVLRQQCVSCIAVVAAVLEKGFQKYYKIVFPTICDMLRTPNNDDWALKGRAAECVTIMGSAVGIEMFEQDAHTIMTILLAMSSPQVDIDSRVREYISEAFCRISRTLGEKFAYYLPHIIPDLLKSLAIPSDGKDSSLEISSHTLKTSYIEEVVQNLEILSTFVSILGPQFGEYMNPAANTVLALLSYRYNDDIQRSTLNTMAEILKAARLYIEKSYPATQTGTGSAANTQIQLQNRSLITNWLEQTLTSTFEYLNDIDEFPDLESLSTVAGGIAKCLQYAGPFVLTAQNVALIGEKVFNLLQMSSIRCNQLTDGKLSPDIDEDDLETLAEEVSCEHTFCSILLEIISALIAHHPNEFMQYGTEHVTQFIETNLNLSKNPNERALALYLCDTILEYLGDNGASLWRIFANQLVDSLNDESTSVRQTAAYGIIHAAKCSKFPPELIQRAAQTIALILQDPASRSKANLLATDNAIAALGSIAVHAGNAVQMKLSYYLYLWISNLPLKADEEEAERVHAEFVKLLLQNNVNVMGSNNENLPRIITICAEIYRTEYSNAEIDKGIRQFAQEIGFDFIQSIAATINLKLQKKLKLVHRDVFSQKS